MARAGQIGRCDVPDPTPAVVATASGPMLTDWLTVGVALVAVVLSGWALLASQRSYQFSGFQLICEKMERHRETVRLILAWEQGMGDTESIPGWNGEMVRMRLWPTKEDLRAYCADMNEAAFLCTPHLRWPKREWSKWLSPEIVPRWWVKYVWGEALARIGRHERFQREFQNLQVQDRQLSVLYAYFDWLVRECHKQWAPLLDLRGTTKSGPRTPKRDDETRGGEEAPQQSPSGE